MAELKATRGIGERVIHPFLVRIRELPLEPIDEIVEKDDLFPPSTSSIGPHPKGIGEGRRGPDPSNLDSSNSPSNVLRPFTYFTTPISIIRWFSCMVFFCAWHSIAIAECQLRT